MTQKSSNATPNLAMLDQCPLPMLYLSPLLRVEQVNAVAEKLSQGSWVGKLLTDLCMGVSTTDLQQALSSSHGLTLKRVRLTINDSFIAADLIIWRTASEAEAGLIVQFWPDMVDIATRHEADAEIQDLGDQLRGVVEENRVEQTALRTTIAQQNELAAELQKVSDELRRSNLDLQQFASAAAHDLQEPLRSVVSYLDLLQEHLGGNLDEKSTKYIGVASAAGRRMQALISDLLQYSRLNTREAAIESVDCNGLVDYAIHDLRSSIEETNATIEVGQLPVIVADPGRIVQVFENLISNAIKFRAPTPPHITINATQQDNFWQFTITDNGIGFDMEYADRIFVIFQRLHGRSKYPGTGIGLAMCKKIIERHGGKIWVESKPDEGSTFYFTLPHTKVTSVDRPQGGEQIDRYSSGR